MPFPWGAQPSVEIPVRANREFQKPLADRPYAAVDVVAYLTLLAAYTSMIADAVNAFVANHRPPLFFSSIRHAVPSLNSSNRI